MNIHVDHVSIEEYQRWEPDRLEQVNAGELYSMFARVRGIGDAALRFAVMLEDVTMGDDGLQHFGIRYTDRDLRPANLKLHLARLVDRYCQVNEIYTGTIGGRSGEIYGGYFAPYEDGFDADFLLFCAEHDQEKVLSGAR